MSTTAGPNRQYAEFDEYIDFQLHRLRTGIRLNDVFTALCGVAVIVTAYLLGFVVLDHWVIPGGFSHSTRVIAVLLLAVSSIVWVGLKVVRPCLRRVNRLYAAQIAESASEELQSNLLNYEDLRRAGRPVPAPVLRAMEKRAAVALSRTDVDEAIDRRLLLRLSTLLLITALIFCLYTVFSPKKVWPSIWRAINPATATQVATETEILDVVPGSRDDVLARTLVEVTVDLRGAVPDSVELVYSTLDRSRVDERLVLRRSDDALKRFSGVLSGPDGDGLLQGLTYHIEAGDAVSPQYRLDVIQPPAARVHQIHYAYPDYMKRRPERRASPIIEAWEGTRLTFSASTNMPVDRAWIEFSDKESFPLNPEPLPMDVEDGTRLSAQWQAMLRDGGGSPAFYRIRCRTQEGVSDPAPAVYPIEIRPDAKPQIEAVFPATDLERPANAVVPLYLRASDPDFLLSRIALKLRKGSTDLPERVLWRGQEPAADVKVDLRLEELHPQPGDVLTWWAEARDNRVIDSPTRRLRDGNVAITPQLRIRILEPVSQPELVEQHAFDEQQRQEKIDALNEEVREGSDPQHQPAEANRDNQDSSDTETRSENSEDSGMLTESPADTGDSSADSSRDDSRATDSRATDSRATDANSPAAEANQSGGDSPEPGRSPDAGRENRAGRESSDSDRQRNPPQDTREPQTGESGDSSPSGQTDADGQAGPRRPLRTDGADDDQVLRELLRKQQRSRQPDSETQSTDDPGDSGRPDESAGRDGDAESRSPGREPQPPSEPSDGSGRGNDEASPDASPDPDAESGQNRDRPEGDRPPRDRGETPADDSSDSPPTASTGRDAADPPGSERSRQPMPRPNDAHGQGRSDSSGESSPGEPTAGRNASDDGQEKGSSGADPNAPAGDEARGGGEENTGTGSGSAEAGRERSGAEENSQAGRRTPAGADGADSEAESETTEPRGPNGESAGETATGGSPPSGRPSDSPRGPESGQSTSGSPENAGRGANGSGTGAKPGTESSGSSSSGSRGSGPNAEGKAKPGQASEASPGGSKGSDSDASTAEQNTAPGQGSDSTGADSSSDRTGGDAPEGSASGNSGKPAGSGQGAESRQNRPNAGTGMPASESDASGGAAGSQSGGGQQPGGQPGRGTGTGGASNQPNSRQSRGTASDGERAPDMEAVNRDAGTGAAEGDLPAADPVSLEDRLKATSLVLKQLREDLDRGRVDRELLDKLGWTEEDMRRFASRLEDRLSDGQQADEPAEAARTRQFHEMLKSLDLDSRGARRSDSYEQKQTTTDFSDLRERVPRKYRGAFEKYLDRLSRQKRGTTP